MLKSGDEDRGNMTMDIRILPSNIANMIAAGEVVQRPASVVKELMENALDAGASQVSVIVRDAGKTLIQVIDNGCGMSPDDAVLCFERHATSKIATKEDLESILTFGFRGEALASIAAVAEVTLRTRREEDESGCEVVFADSQHISTNEISVPSGANFSVRNLFYNVPARRKFLKSDNVEFKHIVTEFTHIALTRYDKGFTLIHNDKEVFVLKPAKSLKFRIQDMFGKNAAQCIIDIAADTTVAKISGYIGRPDSAVKAQNNQYFFINGRYFKSPYFHKAIMKAYEKLVPEGSAPSYYVFMEVAPDAVDVNISPTKTEVKFEDDSVIFQVLYACVREVIGKNSFGGSIDFDAADAPEIPVFGKNFEELYQAEEPQIGTDPMFNPFDNDGFPSESSGFVNSFGIQGQGTEIQGMPSVSMPSQQVYQSQGFQSDDFQPVEQWGSGSGDWGSKGADWDAQFAQQAAPPNDSGFSYAGPASYVDKRDDYGKLFEEKTLPSKSILIVQGKYILTNVKSGVLAVNIRRATERILFERFLDSFSKNEHVTQVSLFPVSVQVGVENMLIFQEHSEMLSSLGFDIRPFGNDTIVVNGVPEGYSAEPGKVQTMVTDLLAVLSDAHSLLPGTVASAMAERFAKLGAAGQDSITSSVEAQRLIDSLFSCSNAEYTSSGHRTMTIIQTEDLDKRF